MPLPVYFVQPPGLSPPPGTLCLCGWFAAPDGSLSMPPAPEHAEALVFDDRGSLPDRFEPVIEEILKAKAEIAASFVVLDLERAPTTTSLSFVKSLSKICRVVAPAPYCRDNEAEPIFCYCPRKETYGEFTQRINVPNAWLELRPVDEILFYPLAGTAHIEHTSECFSEILQCYYRAKSTSQGLHLHFYDTPESLLHRSTALSPKLMAAIGLHNELRDYGFGSVIERAV